MSLSSVLLAEKDRVTEHLQMGSPTSRDLQRLVKELFRRQLSALEQNVPATTDTIVGCASLGVG